MLQKEENEGLMLSGCLPFCFHAIQSLSVDSGGITWLKMALKGDFVLREIIKGIILR